LRLQDIFLWTEGVVTICFSYFKNMVRVVRALKKKKLCFLVLRFPITGHKALVHFFLEMEHRILKYTFDLRCRCSLYSKIKFKNVRKFENQIWLIYLHILCAHLQFHNKPTFFLACAKKDKQMPLKMPYFSTEFCLFCTSHVTIRFFDETTLWTRTM
jgi:hypothetical protein